jgi:hypothetical protein
MSTRGLAVERETALDGLQPAGVFYRRDNQSNFCQRRHFCGSDVVTIGRQLHRRRTVMQIARIGLDLAKYVFEIHGVDAHGKTVVRKTLRRHAVSAFFANLPPCLVGMEASNGAHFWAKTLLDLGHDVRRRCQSKFSGCPGCVSLGA